MRLKSLRFIRQKKNISIGKLAEDTHLTREDIMHIEHGEDITEPTLIRRLASILGVRQSELVKDPTAAHTACAIANPAQEVH